MLHPMSRRDIRWRSSSQLRRQQLPETLRTWLLDQGSLTQRLQDRCGGDVRVQIIQQGYSIPHKDEKRALGLGQRELALVRSVVLFCDDTPWVVARSVIPLTTLSGVNARLKFLGERPLGALLFADPHLRRSEIEVAELNVEAHIGSKGGAVGEFPTQSSWGRRSLFFLDNKPLLVSECFLDYLLG